MVVPWKTEFMPKFLWSQHWKALLEWKQANMVTVAFPKTMPFSNVGMYKAIHNDQFFTYYMVRHPPNHLMLHIRAILMAETTQLPSCNISEVLSYRSSFHEYITEDPVWYLRHSRLTHSTFLFLQAGKLLFHIIYRTYRNIFNYGTFMSQLKKNTQRWYLNVSCNIRVKMNSGY